MVSESFESKWMWTPSKLLVRPVEETDTTTPAQVRFENLTVAEPEGFPTLDMGISASDKAAQTIELMAGSTFARSSPSGLLAV